jgi:hypothetical protein
MSNARNLANLLGTGTQITTADIADGAFQANKNLIINGAMTVNQRGNQVTAGSTQVYFVDRWNIYHNTAAAANLQQSTVVPAGQGFGNSMLIDCTTADTSVASGDIAIMRQVIEGQNLQQLAYGTSSAKSLTISFWVRSTKTGTYILEIYHNDTQSRNQSHSYTISQADTWEKKEITFSGDTSATIDNDNQATLYVQWCLMAGSDFTSNTLQTTWANATDATRFAGQVNFFDSTSNNFYLTGVQMEVGDVATPFEHEDFATTLAKCQRYYFSRSSQTWVFNIDDTDSYRRGIEVFPVRMRATPSVTVTWSGTPGSARGVQYTSADKVVPYVDSESAFASYTAIVGDAEL